MGWIVLGITLSGLGAIPAAYAVVRFMREFKGHLAGYWYQITYDANDDAMTGPIWSIELLKVRHHKDAAHGHMWRIYPHAFDRCWRWEATCEGWLVMGTYQAVRGDGRSGLLLLTVLDPKHLAGHYFATRAVRPTELQVGSLLETAPMEWVALDSCRGAALAEWIPTLPERGCTAYLPWNARRVLLGWGYIRAATSKSILRGSAYMLATQTPQPATSAERAEREDDAHREANPPPIPQVFHRHDVVGIGPVHPKDVLATS